MKRGPLAGYLEQPFHCRPRALRQAPRASTPVFTPLGANAGLPGSVGRSATAYLSPTKGVGEIPAMRLRVTNPAGELDR